MLTELIEKHLAATAEFRATEEGDPDADRIWEAKEDAEEAVIRCPCLTIEDARAKARWALGDEVVRDTLMNCRLSGGGDGMQVFLLSLLGDEPAEEASSLGGGDVTREVPAG